MRLFFPVQLFHRFLLLTGLLCCVAGLRAQDYKFNHIGVEQGLSQSVINCILQDSKGFMWFGTQEGLNRYDGYNFQVFKREPENPNSLSNNFIYTIFEDSKGIIWIGTNGGGLNSFDPSTMKFTHYLNDPKDASSLSNDVVRCIYEDKKGKLWVGTDGGLNEFSNGKFSRCLANPNDPYSISSNRVTVMLEDASDNFWIGTNGGGLSMLDRSTRQFYNYPLSDSDLDHLYPSSVASDPQRRKQCLQVRSLLVTDPSHLWVGTDGAGLQVYNTKTHSYESVMYPDEDASKLSSSVMLTMCDDGRGNTWLGTFDGGLDIYNNSTHAMQVYVPNEQDRYALNSLSIKCVYRDRDGNMWVGTNGEGLNIFFTSTSTIAHIRRSERPGVGENTLKSSKILSVMETRDGLLWIGTLGGGLTTLDRKTGTYTHYPQLSTSSNNSILSLLEGSDGTIWVGTWGEGLNRFDRKSGKVISYSPNKQLRNGAILSIAEEPSTHAIWFGTFGGGLYRLDPATDSLHLFTSKTDSLSSDYIYSLYFDKKDNLWIGTRSGGVMMYNEKSGTFKTYLHDDRNKQSLSNNIVYCIVEDRNGDLWMSTANGLNRFHPDKETFEAWYEGEGGLPSDNIYAILPDEAGNLWLSHNKGLTRFSPAAKESEQFRNFGQGAGVQPAEFNQGAYFRNDKGELFFGGQEGLNVIDMNRAEMKAPPPSVYIISYKRFGKEVHLDSSIISKNRIDVTWRDNNFMFELAALNYIDPSKNLYRYKLEGIDDEWSPATSNRYVSYTNLPGGDYTLLVRASDCNGNWSDEKQLVHIHVEPPFWRTNWFYSLCVVFLIAGIFGFIRYRTAAIRKEKRILEAKVAERTQELAQKNADITSSIQYAKRIQSAILPELDAIFEHLPESFVLYKPKDIVSGDFYWFEERNGKCIIAVGDCTGHGVPGALMSMIGHNLLNQIILEKGITQPDEILNRLNEGVRRALKQDHHEQDTTDGMDIAICCIDKAKREVLFAGALRPLIVMHRGLLTKVESDRFPIGGSQDTRDRKFTLHKFIMEPGDSLYMFSDGYADQFGGEKGKKFMLKNLLQQLTLINPLPMEEQSAKLDEIFEEWRRGYQQVDDVLLVGIRIP